MKIVLVVLLALLTFQIGSAQSPSDSISIKKKMGPVFYQHGSALRMNQLVEITKSNPEAYTYMKKAKSNYNAGSVFAFTGGFLLGFGLGPVFRGEDPSWGLMAAGGGLIGVSVSLTSTANKHAKKAVGIFNDGLKELPKNPQIELSFGLASNGIGLKLRF